MSDSTIPPAARYQCADCDYQTDLQEKLQGHLMAEHGLTVNEAVQPPAAPDLPTVTLQEVYRVKRQLSKNGEKLESTGTVGETAEELLSRYLQKIAYPLANEDWGSRIIAAMKAERRQAVEQFAEMVKAKAAPALWVASENDRRVYSMTPRPAVDMSDIDEQIAAYRTANEEGRSNG